MPAPSVRPPCGSSVTGATWQLTDDQTCIFLTRRPNPRRRNARRQARYGRRALTRAAGRRRRPGRQPTRRRSSARDRWQGLAGRPPLSDARRGPGYRAPSEMTEAAVSPSSRTVDQAAETSSPMWRNANRACHNAPAANACTASAPRRETYPTRELATTRRLRSKTAGPGSMTRHHSISGMTGWPQRTLSATDPGRAPLGAVWNRVYPPRASNRQPVTPGVAPRTERHRPRRCRHRAPRR